MKNDYRHALILTLVFFSFVAAGCGPEQQVKPPQSIESLETTCIQGAVSYRLPENSSSVPFANVKVAAWRHDTTDQPLAETVTDAKGDYCIEVPQGNFSVDVRVWGMVNLEKTSYTCNGSADNISLGTAAKRCDGDCPRADIFANCSVFKPVRRSK